jgi:hypothetical protein
MFRSYTPRHRVPKQRSPRRGLVGIVTLAVGLILPLTLTPSAHAAESPAESFVARDTTTAGVQTDSTESTVTADLITLVQDGRASANAGTSAETMNLGLEVKEDDYLTVDYTVQDPSQANNGSVRFFAYYTQNANTWSTAPDVVAVASNEIVGGESLILHMPHDGTIGTVGVVYDTSYFSTGQVTFGGLGHGPADQSNTVIPLSFVAGVQPEPGDGRDFGQAVADYVKANGRPPEHANAKGLQE